MTVGSLPRQWKLRFVVCLLLAVAGLLAVGAKDVTDELLERPRHRQLVSQCQRAWSRGLILEVPGGHGPQWQKLAAQEAQLILHSCASEARGGLEPDG